MGLACGTARKEALSTPRHGRAHLARVAFLRSMSVQARLKRYLLVLERIQHRPTFAHLRRHLGDHGLQVSARTLQRDIEQIRVELGLEILYDRTNNCYHLPNGKDDRETVLSLLERAVMGGLLGAHGGLIRQAAPYVRIEHHGRLQGLQHWGPLLRAIRERREVKVSYRRFQTGKEKVIPMRPYLLKEYCGRWYALGLADGYDQPISLGLDRMLAVQVSSRRFAKTDHLRVEAFYEPVIGVDTSPGEAERIVLRFTPLQGKYAKALPLHPSQHVLSDDADGLVVSLHVMPNFELRQQLLGLGAAVQVLQPRWLAKEIRTEHKRAAELR